MEIGSIKRWQWIVISILIGIGIGYVRNNLDEDITRGYPDHLSTAEFERYSVATYTVVGGEKKFWFRGMSVELVLDPTDTPTKTVRQVTKDGKFANLVLADHGYVNGQKVKITGSSYRDYNGTFAISKVTRNSFAIEVGDKAPNKPGADLSVTAPQRLMYLVKGVKRGVEALKVLKGKLVYDTVPNYLLVPYGRYEPTNGLPGPAVTYKPSTMQRLFEKLRIKEPDPAGSVLDYLATIQAATGNGFEYYWWTQPRVRIAVWTAGSFVFFGLIFPTLVNIMVFGTLIRPKEEKAVSLKNVKATPQTAATPQSKVTQGDWDQLKALEAELEKKLAGNTVTDAAATPPEDFEMEPLEKAPPKLNEKTAEPVVVVPQTQEQHDFARKTGDFYPVERGQHARDKDRPKTPEKK